jgi:hypothetical protein
LTDRSSDKTIKSTSELSDPENGMSLLIFSIFLISYRIITSRTDYSGSFFSSGEAMNQVLNDNWELLFKELRPAFVKAIAEVFLDYAKRIFDKVPYNEIFLD